MAIRFLYCDQRGIPYDEPNILVSRVPYLYNSDSTVNFTVPPGANMPVPGDFLLILHPELGVWAGVIQSNCSVARYGSTLSAKSSEWLLRYIFTPRFMRFSSQSSGAIFKEIIRYSASILPVPLHVGSVWHGSSIQTREVYFQQVFSFIVDSLCREFNLSEFRLRAKFDRSLALYADYKRDFDQNHRYLNFIEGVNLFGVTKEVVDPVVNHWTIVGTDVSAVSAWDGGRIAVDVSHSVSQIQFGRRSGIRFRNDLYDPLSLTQVGLGLLDETAIPRIRIRGIVPNIPSSSFGSFSVGDRIGLQVHSFDPGTKGPLKLIEYVYLVGVDACEVVLSWPN